MTAHVTAIAVGVLLLALGVMATAGPGQPSRAETGNPAIASHQAFARDVALVMAESGPPAGGARNAAGTVASLVATRPGILSVTSALNGFERVTTKSGAWARLLLIGSGLLSLGLIVRRRLLDENGETETA